MSISSSIKHVFGKIDEVRIILSGDLSTSVIAQILCRKYFSSVCVYFLHGFVLFREGTMKVLYCGRSSSWSVYKNPGDQFIVTPSCENLFLKMMETLQPFHFHFRQGRRHKHQAWGRVEKARNSGTWHRLLVKIPLNGCQAT